MTNPRRLSHTSLVLAALCAATTLGVLDAGTSASAEAQTRRSGPVFVSAGIGPVLLIDAGDRDASFRLEGGIGWHPGGHDEGFFLGADFAFTIERNYAQVYGGFRLGGDIEVFANNDVAVLLTPQGMAGFGWFDFGRGAGSYGFLIIQPSFQVDVALLERVLWIWARPVGFDFLLFPDTFRRSDGSRGFDWYVGYQFMAGARFNFG